MGLFVMLETFMFSTLMAGLLLGAAFGAVIIAKWFDIGNNADKEQK